MKVKENQVIALIDPELADSAVERDEAVLASQMADLERVKALRDQAKNNRDRARRPWQCSWGTAHACRVRRR